MLGQVFAVDVCAYAVMSNNFHLAVRVDAERAAGWSDAQVVESWVQLLAGSPPAWRRVAGAELTPEQAERATEQIATLRTNRGTGKSTQPL